MASSWSCVTWRNVKPTSCWIRLSSSCICLAELEVERPERLVEEQDARAIDERAGERDALLLAARQLRGLRPPNPASPTMREHLVDLPADLVLSTPRRRRPKATFSKTLRCGKSA